MEISNLVTTMEATFNKSNKETAEWINEMNKLNLSLRQWIKEADKFFGNTINITPPTFKLWKVKFLKTCNDVKKEITQCIMEEWGGLLGTRYYDIPPKNYFPSDENNFYIDRCNYVICNVCNSTFTNVSYVKEHVKAFFFRKVWYIMTNTKNGRVKLQFL